MVCRTCWFIWRAGIRKIKDAGTAKPGKLYIHLFKRPTGKFELSKVRGRVTKAYLPANAPGESASVLVLQTGSK